MSVSSEKFELLADDLETALDEARSGLDRMAKAPGSSANHASRVREDLSEARRIIEEMEREARMAPAQYRGEMLEKVRHYRVEMSRLQHLLKKVTEKQSNVSVHFKDETTSRLPLTEEETYRRQVRAGTSILDRTTQSIVRSQQVALESEAVGEDILDDLGCQRETLERARTRLEETGEELSKSRRVLRRLSCGICQNKATLILIIVVEVLILAAIIYLRFIKHHGS